MTLPPLPPLPALPPLSALLLLPPRCGCCCFGSPEGPGGSSTRDVNGPGAGGERVFFFAGLLSLSPLLFAKISGPRRHILLNCYSNCLLACLSYRSCCFIIYLSFRSYTVALFRSRVSPHCACPRLSLSSFLCCALRRSSLMTRSKVFDAKAVVHALPILSSSMGL